MTLQQGSNGSLGDLSIEREGLPLRTRKELTDRVEQLYEEHYEGFFRYLVYLGNSPEDADEFIQEAFLRLFQGLRDGKRIQTPKSWLLGVLHHIRVDDSRRTKRSVEYDALPVEAWESKTVGLEHNPEMSLLQKERAEHLRTIMAQLTERQFQYLLLRTEGLKLREIAAIFGVTVQSVAEACTRALSRLGRVTHE